ncbi:hypothetical protein KBC79_06735 [Candidatus Woesebacteria bacterium]|nr:hypothetical protein [Candidatus Woesebacteria bacterium]
MTVSTRHAGFCFTRFVIIESLESFETKTGLILFEFIQSELDNAGLTIPIEYKTCANVVEFREILGVLVHQADSQGEIPILHIECHGDLYGGLEFENGSNLSWDHLSDALRPLNAATRFNLLACFAACFGAYFIGEISTIKASPVWAVFAPTETLDPGEVIAGQQAFYSNFIRTFDAGRAASATTLLKLETGKWITKTAQEWFESVVQNYVNTHCNRNEIKIRTMEMYKRQVFPKRHLSFIKRQLRNANRTSLTGNYFNTFFMIDKIPENVFRFSETKTRLTWLLSSLRAKGFGV